MTSGPADHRDYQCGKFASSIVGRERSRYRRMRECLCSTEYCGHRRLRKSSARTKGSQHLPTSFGIGVFRFTA